MTSWLFEAFFAAVILSNSVFIAVQIEVASQRDPNAKPDHAFFTIASIYTFFFTIEPLNGCFKRRSGLEAHPADLREGRLHLLW